MDKIGLGTANWLVIIVYLIAMLGVGLYFTKKAGKNTDEFLLPAGKYRRGQQDLVFMLRH